MASDPINLQREITATGILKSVASETQGAPNEIVAAMPGTDFATAAQGAKADTAVQPGQRNLLDYATGTTLSPGTAVYRAALNADGTFPAIDATAIESGSAYYCFELELAVPATVPSTITGPSGWTWIDGQELPDPSDLSGGETIYIAARLDCASGARTFLASVWRVA